MWVLVDQDLDLGILLNQTSLIKLQLCLMDRRGWKSLAGRPDACWVLQKCVSSPDWEWSTTLIQVLSPPPGRGGITPATSVTSHIQRVQNIQKKWWKLGNSLNSTAKRPRNYWSLHTGVCMPLVKMLLSQNAHPFFLLFFLLWLEMDGSCLLLQAVDKNLIWICFATSEYLLWSEVETFTITVINYNMPVKIKKEKQNISKDPVLHSADKI